MTQFLHRQLRGQIDVAIEADWVLNMLMGDIAESRQDFIEVQAPWTGEYRRDAMAINLMHQGKKLLRGFIVSRSRLCLLGT